MLRIKDRGKCRSYLVITRLLETKITVIYINEPTATLALLGGALKHFGSYSAEYIKT